MGDARDTTSGPGGGAAPAMQLGSYVILARLTQSPHGGTFLARDAGSGEPVTLKALRTCRETEDLRTQFAGIRERLAGLTHPNVCAFLGSGEDETTRLHYYAWERPPGESLWEILERSDRLSESEALAIAIQIANALDAVYARKLVHGDLTPSGVLVVRGGIARLMTLGLAEPLTDAMHGSGESVHYLSPEVAASGVPDIRSDMYSLGAILYHMVTGVMPFESATREAALEGHREGHLAWPSDAVVGVSEGLSRVIARLMARDPAQRYRTPNEMVLDLNIVKQGQPPVIAAHAPSDSAVSRTRRKVTPRPTGPRHAEPGPSPVPKHAHGHGTRATIAVVDKPMATKANAVRLAAAAAGVVALGVLAMLAMRAGAPTSDGYAPLPPPLPLPPSTPIVLHAPGAVVSPGGPAGAANAQAMLAEARVFDAAHPSAFDDIAARYDRCRAAAAGTPLAADVDAAASAARQRQLAAASAALEAAIGEAEAAASAGDFDGAIAALDGVPASLRSAVAERMRTVVAELKSRGDARIRAIVDGANTLSAAGDTAGARVALLGLEAVKHRSGRELLQAIEDDALRRIREAETRGRDESLRKVREILPAVMATYDAAIDGGRYWEAYQLARETMAKPEFSAAAAFLGGAMIVAGDLSDRAEVMQAAVVPLVGKDIALRTSAGPVRGKVAAARYGGIELEPDAAAADKTPRLVTWTQLTPEEEAPLAKAWEPSGPGSASLALALVALSRGDVAGARVLAQKASDHPLAAHVRGRIDAAAAARK